MSSGFIWGVPPLDAEDQKLVDAYLAVGRPVDALPYTDDFERVWSMLGLPDTKEARHQIYRRLMRLRKQGRLPRVSAFAD